MRRIWTLQRSCTVVAVAVFCCTATELSAQQNNSADEVSVDEALLDDLGDDLLEGLEDFPSGLGDDDRNKSADDRKLLEELGAGEDIGSSGEDELTRIARQMRHAQRRIEQQKVSADTQEIQKDVIAQLDALIKQLQQQKKRCDASGSNKPAAGGGQIKQPDQQPDQGQQKPSNKPARDSVERVGRENAAATDAAALEALVKQVWGHLPDRARQEMQNAAVEDFLPKYQQVIEDYYRSLAEQPPR